MKKAAFLWISVFLSAALFASLDQKNIETHFLSETLHFGKDAFGRNCLNLTLCAAFKSFQAILPMAALSLLLSLALSLLTLSASSRIHFLVRALLDTLSSLPAFLIALAISAFLPNSVFLFFFASIFLVFPSLTRFWESHLLKLKSEEFIQASVALGSSHFHLFWRHYLPEFIPLTRSILPFLLTRLLLIETSLSFVGIGRAPRHETWGRLLYQGKDYLIEAPWILLISSLPLCLTLFSFHLLGRSDPN